MVPCADGSWGREEKPLRWNVGQTMPPGQEGACIRSRKKPPGFRAREQWEIQMFLSGSLFLKYSNFKKLLRNYSHNLQPNQIKI